MKKTIILSVTGFLLAMALVSCNNNMFTNFSGYRENNNPNAFSSIAMVEHENMNRLSFGTSSGSASSGSKITVNDDGSINLCATNTSTPPNAGKIAGSEDGITFYFKEVDANKNFKLSADAEVVHFGSGEDLNGQEGFGIMARDYVPQYPNKTMADLIDVGATSTAYYAGSTGGCGNMIMVGGVKRGVRVYWRRGVTDPSGGQCMTDAGTIADGSKAEFFFVPKELPDYSLYSTLNDRPDFPSVGTKYNLYLEKTNSGFHVIITPPPDKGGDIAYNMDPYTISTGNPVNVGVGKKLEYFISEPDMLFAINKTHYYVGFFACRDAEVKISNINYSEAEDSDCAPKIDRLPDYWTPSLTVTSPAATGSGDYIFSARANVEGNVAVSLNGVKLPDSAGMGVWTTEPSNAVAVPFTNITFPVTGLKDGDNVFQLAFYPDPKQSKSQYLLASPDAVLMTFVVTRKTYADADGCIYVSPDGRRTNRGTRDSPLDLDSGIAYVQPGQKIEMLDGVYTPLRVLIPENNSGLPNSSDNNPVNLASYKDADGNILDYYKYYKVLEAVNRDRAVIDFLGDPQNQGFVLRGDYWILSGFHVRRTGPAKVKGLTLMGNHNRLEWLRMYMNGDSGLQISGNSADPKAFWPSYNIVTHCESFYNKDVARVDADGFGAKLTVGDGNRYEWCVSHNNADDCWDLFSKKESGATGIVTIEYCIAYESGFIPQNWNPPAFPVDWTTYKGGNGNGFKMGGEGIPIKHLAQNCLSFNNGAAGFTSNSNPAIVLNNCTAYNSGQQNFAVYGSENGGSSVGLDARVSYLLSMFPAGTSRSDDRVDWQSTYTNVGFVWRSNQCQNKSGTALTLANNIVSTDTPWISQDIQSAPWANEITGDIQGKWIARNDNGTFKIGNFMKTQNINGSQPGCKDLYQ